MTIRYLLYKLLLLTIASLAIITFFISASRVNAQSSSPTPTPSPSPSASPTPSPTSSASPSASPSTGGPDEDKEKVLGASTSVLGSTGQQRDLILLGIILFAAVSTLVVGLKTVRSQSEE